MHLVKKKEGEGSTGRGPDHSDVHLTLSQTSPSKLFSAPGYIFKCQDGFRNLYTFLWKMKNLGTFSCLFQGNLTVLLLGVYQGRVWSLEGGRSDRHQGSLPWPWARAHAKEWGLKPPRDVLDQSYSDKVSESEISHMVYLSLPPASSHSCKGTFKGHLRGERGIRKAACSRKQGEWARKGWWA